MKTATLPRSHARMGDASHAEVRERAAPIPRFLVGRQTKMTSLSAAKENLSRAGFPPLDLWKKNRPAFYDGQLDGVQSDGDEDGDDDNNNDNNSDNPNVEKCTKRIRTAGSARRLDGQPIGERKKQRKEKERERERETGDKKRVEK